MMRYPFIITKWKKGKETYVSQNIYGERSFKVKFKSVGLWIHIAWV